MLRWNLIHLNKWDPYRCSIKSGDRVEATKGLIYFRIKRMVPHNLSITHNWYQPCEEVSPCYFGWVRIIDSLHQSEIPSGFLCCFDPHIYTNKDLYSLSGGTSYRKSHDVSKVQVWMYSWLYHSEYWKQSRWCCCCRDACQHSERFEKSIQTLRPRVFTRYCGKAFVRLVDRPRLSYKYDNAYLLHVVS